MIDNYKDFCRGLLTAGFSGAVGGGDDRVFGLLRRGCGQNIRWHTGDKETDPWEWRVRVLNERKDIAYSKLFFRKAGYITEEWYPYFLAARRDGRDFDDFYNDGLYNRSAKRIFDFLSVSGAVPLEEIKSGGGFAKTEKARFDKAITDLQMKMFITICGEKRRRKNSGEEYGWASTVFCLTEDFWGHRVFEKANSLEPREAEEKITRRLLELHPNAELKKIKSFIYG